MSRSLGTTAASFCAAAALALVAPARAHDSEEFHFHIDPLVFEVLEVDVDTNSSKFNEYRDLQSGFNIPEFRLFGDSSDHNRSVDLRAEHVLRDDARYQLDYAVAGEWGLLLDYNKIPHRFGNDGTLLWTETSRGVLELPNSMQQFFQTAIASGGTSYGFLNGLLTPFIETADRVDLGLQRDRTHARLDVHKLQRFAVTVDVEHENRDGIRPYATSFGFSNAIELFEPIDYATTHATAAAEMNGERGGVRLGYRHSDFENDTDTLLWDNWQRATDISGGPSRGFADVAPDNDAGFLFAQGRYGFGSGFRLSGNIGYNLMEQDDPLLPYTLNTALVGIDHETGATFDPTSVANLPRASTEAEAEVLNFDINAGFDLGDDLRFKLFYRYYDYDNQTPRTVFDGFAVFHSTWTAEPRVTVPYAFSRDDIGAEAEWDFSDRSGLELSYHRKTYDREFREVESSDEDVVKLSFDTRLFERFTVRASYEVGDRTIDGYRVEAQLLSFLEPTAINNQPGLRKYDEAERDYEDWELSVLMLLTEAWNLNVGVSGRDEDYDESQFGLLSDDILQLSADLSWSPSEDLAFYLFAHSGDRETFQRDRQSGGTLSTNPADDWSIDFDEVSDTAGLGFNGSPHDRFKWDVSGNWSKSDGDADFGSPPGGTSGQNSAREPVDFDNYEDVELLELVLQLDYVVSPRFDLGLLYRYEDYTIDSFNRQGLKVYLPSTLLLLANDGDYQADVFGLRFKVDL